LAGTESGMNLPNLTVDTPSDCGVRSPILVFFSFF